MSNKDERDRAVYFALGAIKATCESKFRSPREKVKEILKWVENPEGMMRELEASIKGGE